MSGVGEERQNQIEELDTFIHMTQDRLMKIILDLGWTLETISKETQHTVICPFNNGHRLKEESLKDHLDKCQWKAEGYTENELPLSEPCLSVNSSSAIKFDEQLQEIVLQKAREENPTLRIVILIKRDAITPATGVADRLVPRTSDRLITSFTSDERTSIYNYVIANTIKPDIGDDIADMNRPSQKDGNQPKTSLLELLAQERNLKRRRAKHRGVHTNKKSQVEILREVINQQMEMYEEYLADSSIKSEPKSPGRSEASSLDYQAYADKKNYQQPKYDAEWPRRNSSRNDNKYYDRSSNHQTFLPAKRSLPRDSFFNRDKKRDKSKSMERERKRDRSKQKRDRSKNRNRHQERRERHRVQEEKTYRDEDYKSEDKSDRRKRRCRSRDRSSKHMETSRQREKSGDKYYKETDKRQKRNH